MTGWSIPLDRLADRSKARLETVVRAVTLNLFVAVVRRAPVDTGRFRANFNVSYGAPNLTFTDSTAAARGMTEARRVMTLPAGGIMFLSNGLPYAGVLERGSSRQAPNGMVGLAVVELQEHVRKALATT